MSIEFHTRDCIGAERLATWEKVISQHHVTVASATKTHFGDNFEGWLKIDDWAGLQILHTESSSILYERGTKEMRSSNIEDFLCVLIVAGEGVLESNGRRFEFQPDDLLFYDTNQLYSLHFPAHVKTVSLRIPRVQIRSRLPQADHHFAIKVDGKTPLGKLAGQLVASVAALNEFPSERTCREAESPILDVLCLAVKDSMGEMQQATPGQGKLLQRVKHNIIEHIEDSDLTVDSIAQMHGISRRTVNRLFASEGTTVMRWVWSQRLSASYRALSDGSVRQVTEAAYRYGFKDTSHFARAFKREFNISPSKLLTD